MSSRGVVSRVKSMSKGSPKQLLLLVISLPKQMEMKQCLVTEADSGRNALLVGVCPSRLVCPRVFPFLSPPALPPCSKPNHKSGDSQDHTVHFMAVLFSIWKISLQNVLEILKK